MIELMFQKGGNNTLVRIENKNLRFAKVSGGYLLWSGIDGLKFDVNGVLLEFPDLKGKSSEDILKIGKERFKEHIKSLKSETEIKDYLVKDLSNHNFKLLFTQRKGHRIQRCQ